jgi:hypothetical protein
MREFLALRQELFLNPRQLTREEYRIIKTQPDWYNQKKFWIMHLTEAGFNMYNEAPSEGQLGKWEVYCRIWELTNTPLFKAMNE